MANYLSEIVADEQIKKVYECIQGVDPSSLSTLSSFYDSNIETLKTSFTSSAFAERNREVLKAGIYSIGDFPLRKPALIMSKP